MKVEKKIHIHIYISKFNLGETGEGKAATKSKAKQERQQMRFIDCQELNQPHEEEEEEGDPKSVFRSSPNTQ